MGKFIFKYFFNFLGPQKKWLNEMAGKGWRLVEVSTFGYRFERCLKSEYIYEVVYSGYRRKEISIPYLNRLLDSGYNVFIKGLNRTMSSEKLKLKHSLGKVYNPKFSPRDGYKDVLIIEKKNDGKSFEVISVRDNNLRDLKFMRAIALGLTILVIVLFFSGLYSEKPALAAIFAILFSLPLYGLIRFSSVIKNCLEWMLESIGEEEKTE